MSFMSKVIKPRPAIDPLLAELVALNGSDMYLTVGVPPSVRVSDRIVALADEPLTGMGIQLIVSEVLSEDQLQEFNVTYEYNLPLAWTNDLRFRINVFRQQQHPGMVIRRIQSQIPTIEQLGLPKIYQDIIMENRGLILVVGPTGSGKSSSLAAMIGHRNRNGFGHIITIEDPIEYVHHHAGCIITQRDVGVDTYSYSMALNNTLRQRPDVVLIGEVRDKETLEHALHFSETGHLCVTTLHAGNVMQAVERVLNFFPLDKHSQLQYNLSQNLKAVLAQRLVPTMDGGRAAVVEIMLNRGLIRTLIQEGKIKDIPDLMAKNANEGMQTLDQALLQLYKDKIISEDVAVKESDNASNLRLMIRQTQPVSRLSVPSLNLRNPGNATF